MLKYNAYVQPNKRRLPMEEDITLERAIDFLASVKHGVIYDSDNNKLTKEELEYAKSLRSLPGIGEDSLPSSGGSIPEDTGGELFNFAGDNSESSTERDTEWD